MFFFSILERVLLAIIKLFLDLNLFPFSVDAVEKWTKSGVVLFGATLIDNIGKELSSVKSLMRLGNSLLTLGKRNL